MKYDPFPIDRIITILARLLKITFFIIGVIAQLENAPITFHYAH